MTKIIEQKQEIEKIRGMNTTLEKRVAELTAEKAELEKTIVVMEEKMWKSSEKKDGLDAE